MEAMSHHWKRGNGFSQDQRNLFRVQSMDGRGDFVGSCQQVSCAFGYCHVKMEAKTVTVCVS